MNTRLSVSDERLLRNERHHRPKQDRLGERVRRREQHAAGDVRPVREPDGDRACVASKPYCSAAAADERDEILRARVQILEIEHALGQPAEEARRAVLEHRAARAQQARVGREHLAELNQIVLVAAGAVEQQQRAPIVALGRQVPMNVRRRARRSR